MGPDRVSGWAVDAAQSLRSRSHCDRRSGALRTRPANKPADLDTAVVFTPSETDMAIKYSGDEALQRAAIKRGIVLRHLQKWEIADPYVISKLLDLRRTATFTTIQNMIGEGLIASHRVSGCPTPILHLTPAGASALHQVMYGEPYLGMHSVVYPSKLNVSHVQHDLLVQRLVIDIEMSNDDVEVLSARQIVHYDKQIGKVRLGKSAKIPDALLIRDHEDGQRLTAVEVQESAEPDPVAERKLSQYFEAIKNNEVYDVIYASTSLARLTQVNRLWRRKLRQWWYNSDQKKWFPTNPEKVLFDKEIIDERMTTKNIALLSTGLYQHVIL